MNEHAQMFLGMSKKWELKKGFNAVFKAIIKYHIVGFEYIYIAP
jgi:hypothetical protein